MFNDTTAQNENRLLGVRQMVNEVLFKKGRDIFDTRDVVESRRFHPTLIVIFLKETKFYHNF